MRTKMIMEPRLNLDTLILRQYQICMQRDDLQKLICAFGRVGSKKQRIQHHAGGLSRLLTGGAKKRGHAIGEEILPKIYSRAPRLNLETLIFRQYQMYTPRLNLDTLIFKPYQTYMPRDSLQRLHLMTLKPDKIESKPSFVAWRGIFSARARP